MEDYSLALMTGTDIPIIECQLIVHQPTIKEIGMIGEREFFSGAQCLCIDKSMIAKDENLTSITTNFQIFMMVMQEKETKDKKADVLSVLSLLIPNSKVILTPRALLFNYNNSNITIDEGNFLIFQNAVKKIFCMDQNQEEEFNPSNEDARKIAEKIKKGRQRVAQLKGETSGSLFARYVSFLAVGIHSMSLNDLLNCTIYQINDLVKRYTLYLNWDLDIRSRLAGATGEGKPED